MTAPSVARSPGRVGELGPGLWRLGYIVVADLAFLFGVLVPYLTDDDIPPVDSTWDALFWPGLVSVFFLPLVACGVAVFSGAQALAQRRRGPRRQPGRRGPVGGRRPRLRLALGPGRDQLAPGLSGDGAGVNDAIVRSGSQ